MRRAITRCFTGSIDDGKIAIHITHTHTRRHHHRLASDHMLDLWGHTHTRTRTPTHAAATHAATTATSAVSTTTTTARSPPPPPPPPRLPLIERSANGSHAAALVCAWRECCSRAACAVRMRPPMAMALVGARAHALAGARLLARALHGAARGAARKYVCAGVRCRGHVITHAISRHRGDAMSSVSRQIQPSSRALCESAAIKWRPTSVDEGRARGLRAMGPARCQHALSPRASRLDERLRTLRRALIATQARSPRHASPRGAWSWRSRCAWRTSWLQDRGAMHGTCCDNNDEVHLARC